MCRVYGLLLLLSPAEYKLKEAEASTLITRNSALPQWGL